MLMIFAVCYATEAGAKERPERDSAMPMQCCSSWATRPTGSWSIWGPGFESWSGARFSKVPRTFRAQKAICKSTTCLFCKAGLFICCKGNKNNNNCKVSCLETPLFWKYKENYVTQDTPDKFRDIRETGPRPEIFRPFFRYSLSSTASCEEH